MRSAITKAASDFDSDRFRLNYSVLNGRFQFLNFVLHLGNYHMKLKTNLQFENQFLNGRNNMIGNKYLKQHL